MDKIVNLIMEKIEEFNETTDTKIDLSDGKDSVLFGQGGALESVDFVSLVLDVEQAVEEEYGQSISLTDSRAMSQKHSPFRTVGTLAEYIENELKGIDHE